MNVMIGVMIGKGGGRRMDWCDIWVGFWGKFGGSKLGMVRLGGRGIGMNNGK